MDDLTSATARRRSERFLARMPEYPGGFEGRGIVIPAGGTDRFTQAWIGIRRLRDLGCALPIQLWHLGPGELDDAMRSLLAPLSVECVDAHRVRRERPARILNGWEMKPYAILHCPYREVLLLDADTLAVTDPEPLFASRPYRQTGALFWPDTGRLGPQHEIWDLCGVSYRDEPEFDGGQILTDKERCWDPLSLCMWYNEHSDFFYRYLYGDKETFHLAFRKLGVPYSHPHESAEVIDGIHFHYDADGVLAFQHKKKWRYAAGPDDDRGLPVLVHGERCRAYLEELRGLWDGRVRPDGLRSTGAPRRPTVSPSTAGLATRPFQCPVYTHDRGDFRSVSNTNVLIYWPHGLGDWVHLSYILPWLDRTNRYWITRFGDDSTSLMEGNAHVTPLYLGTNSPHCDDGAAFGCRHFGLVYDEIDGGGKTLLLPESLHRQCCRFEIGALLWTWYPESHGWTPFPFHTKARSLLTSLAPDPAALPALLQRPLPSTIDFDVSPMVRQWVEARLRNFAAFGGRRLCLIARTGYTSIQKNWGHLWREDLPPGRQREGEECRDFMRLLLRKDPDWMFLVMEDRLMDGDDTVRSRDLHAHSYAELFGQPGAVTMPYGLVLKALVGLASLTVGVPAGPFHLSMAKPGLPTVGLWIDHLPSWYDEPRADSVHLVSRNLSDTGADARPGSFESAGDVRYRIVRTDTRIITGEQTLEAVEQLLY